MATSWDLCFGFVLSVFQVMTHCLVQDTHIIFMWLNHWQCLSYFCQLHVCSGQDTNLVNAVYICKK